MVENRPFRPDGKSSDRRDDRSFLHRMKDANSRFLERWGNAILDWHDRGKQAEKRASRREYENQNTSWKREDPD